jgi:hypothetical protein
MARRFRSASSDFIGAGITSPSAPLTLSVWFRTLNNTSNHMRFGLFDDAASADGFYLSATTSNILQGVIVAAGSFTTFDALGSVGTGKWMHACAVFETTTARTAYLDGAAGTLNTTSKTPAAVDNLWMGKFRGGSTTFSDVELCDAARWNVALTPDEVRQLARGKRPTAVRPGSLLNYYPLDEPAVSAVRDRAIGAVHITQSGGSSVWVPRPSVLRPPRRSDYFANVVGGGGGPTSILRQMMQLHG